MRGIPIFKQDQQLILIPFQLLIIYKKILLF